MRVIALCTFLFALSLGLSSCGEDEVSARANVTLHWAAFSATDVLKVYAIAPQRTDGADLSCAALRSQQPALDDSSLQIFAQSSARAADLETGAVDLQLSKIPAGENRIFAAEVRDSNSQRVGFGCTQGITIRANEEQAVSISVDEL